MSKLYSLKHDMAIFQIPLPNSKFVYMRVERETDDNYDSKRYVVIVNSEKFLKLWQNAGGNSNCQGIALRPYDWGNDRKYHFAAEGFSKGEANPVPLAHVSCYSQPLICVEHFFSGKGLLYKDNRYIPKILINRKVWVEPDFDGVIGFTNGITRTIWLLNNGAKSFPVWCYGSSLSILLKTKEKGTRLYSMGDFFSSDDLLV